MSSAILTPNFPTHVPPYFWTSHLASGSIVFWCRFGGVLGGEADNEDDLEDNGDGVDIMEEGVHHFVKNLITDSSATWQNFVFPRRMMSTGRSCLSTRGVGSVDHGHWIWRPDPEPVISDHRQVFGKSLAANITSRTASRPQLLYPSHIGNKDKVGSVVCTVY